MQYILKHFLFLMVILSGLLCTCEPEKGGEPEPTENCAIEKVFAGTDSLLVRHEFVNNRLNKTFLYNSNENYIGYKTYDYASRTRIIIKEYNTVGTLLWLTTAILDDAGNPISEVRERFGKPKTFHQSTTYSYDGEGYLTRKVLRYAEDPEVSPPTTYTTITTTYQVAEGQIELLRQSTQTISSRDTLSEVLRMRMDYANGVSPKPILEMPYPYGKAWTALPSGIEFFYNRSDSAAATAEIFYELDENGYLAAKRTRMRQASGRIVNSAELFLYKCGLKP
ncbi:MAG: hypothetical protein EAZ57_10200 [Cytophagales bacterium]|nr:MAG: hypothetical protein EAZ67_05990 [Cytophagales bacterium]TAF59705.1 MAG: hypothetical protein EAZ57_10200 [Cytophagales bacterium]